MSKKKPSRWDLFWFSPTGAKQTGRIRCLLCIISIVFFFSGWSDIDQWYGNESVLSVGNVANAIHIAGAEQEGKWGLSPLFLTDNTLLYRFYLLAGVVVSVTVLFGRAGRIAGFLLWALVVGLANRSMMLSSLAETLLSLGLFAIAFSQPTSVVAMIRGWNANDHTAATHWTNRFSTRLMSVQVSVIAASTFATMLAGRVWWNGLGAYALAAPVQDRTIDWSQTALSQTFVYELLTFSILAALPIGLAMLWLRDRATMGVTLLVGWCVVVALLTSHWLFAATMATMTLSFCGQQHPRAESGVAG